MKHSKCITYGLQLIFGCLLSCLLVGCISTNSKYVERKQYLLDLPGNLAKKATASSDCSILLDQVDAVAPFDKLDFLYRTNSDRYLIDYYNGFLVLPSEQLDTILGPYLRVYGGFNINITEDIEGSQNRLKVKLTELYADYRNRNAPQAVIGVQFILSKLIEGKTVVVVDKVFRKSVALSGKNTDSLLSGWNKGLKEILMQGAKVIKNKVGC
ncbi:MAG: hypothetical protein KKE11_02350 [Gammaproteobacteria bacterium]|nr:hypothetical protein [Gammaproteobacteria bacterium]